MDGIVVGAPNAEAHSKHKKTVPTMPRMPILTTYDRTSLHESVKKITANSTKITILG
jgi:hypothetical protein